MLELNLYEVLTETVRKYKPKSYLEIGVQDGNSLRTVLRADIDKNIETLFLCDTWGGHYGGTSKGNHAHIHNLLTQEKFEGSVAFLDGDSKVLIPQLTDRFDLILVDADHSEAGCYTDMMNAWPLLNKGGCMVIDDLIHPAHTYIHDLVLKFTGEYHETVETTSLYINKPNGAAVIRRKGVHRAKNK